MNRIERLAAAGLLALFFALHAASAQADIFGAIEDGRSLDRIVAIANEDVITRAELDERLREIRVQLQRRGTPLPPEAALKRQVLERMVVERLQLQEARRLGITIDDFTLNDALQRIAESNDMTLAEFRNQLVADGVDFPHFREQAREEMAIDRLRRRQVDARIQVSDQEIDDLIASERGALGENVEYHVAHILVGVPEDATTDKVRAALARAQEIRARALAGEDFASLAAEKSDAEQALDGGDLGWRVMSQVPTVFARALSLMEPGGISEPVRSPSGYHIVKLIDRRGSEKLIVTQTHARHILIQPSALISDEEAQARLASLRTRILAGEDFAELARANSDDKSSAMHGGDLGWADPGDFVPDFTNALNRLAPGEISEPFRSPFGWHIAQALERRDHDSTREALRARAREFIRDRKRAEELDLWLRRLRGEAFVEYRLE